MNDQQDNQDTQDTQDVVFKQKKLTPEEQEALRKAMEDAIRSGGLI